jgi:cytochrome c553
VRLADPSPARADAEHGIRFAPSTTISSRQDDVVTLNPRAGPSDTVANTVAMAKRMGAWWLAMACAAPAGAWAQDDAVVPAFRQIDSMEARVQGCVTCHGQSGQGTKHGYFPRIAGKPARYLYHQLVAFRDGTRRYPPMNYLVAYLPDSYLRDMAEHYSRLRPPFAPKEPANVDNATLARGQSLATIGDPAQGIPACVSCHGKALTGMEPGIPGLVGLRATYIAAQLTRWRVGERQAAEPDCMKRIASRLSNADVAAVAAWLGQQEPPQDPSPERADLVRMPYACGTQGQR